MENSGNNISINKNKNKLLNKNDLEIKQRKRLNSQPLKSFKISSLAESKILSIICDNIFEDVNIDQNNDPSMINLSSNIILEENKDNDNINKININEEENNNILKNLLILNYIYKKKSNESYLSSMNLFELLNIIEKNKNNQTEIYLKQLNIFRKNLNNNIKKISNYINQ